MFIVYPCAHALRCVAFTLYALYKHAASIYIGIVCASNWTLSAVRLQCGDRQLRTQSIYAEKYCRNDAIIWLVDAVNTPHRTQLHTNTIETDNRAVGKRHSVDDERNKRKSENDHRSDDKHKTLSALVDVGVVRRPLSAAMHQCTFSPARICLSTNFGS